jgi:hypothetical protein
VRSLSLELVNRIAANTPSAVVATKRALSAAPAGLRYSDVVGEIIFFPPHFGIGTTEAPQGQLEILRTIAATVRVRR